MNRAEYIFNKISKGGESTIDEFIQDRISEELFLDFKRSHKNGSSTHLEINDRKNLAKSIAGFGNSEGGVIVWGVDCSTRNDDGADVANFKKPIQNIKRFASLIEGAISGCTLPPHGEVINFSIVRNDGSGFLVTLIPKSNRIPHQSVVDSKFYIRAGSSFLPAPYGVLAGMFGKVPQPSIFLTFLFHAEFEQKQRNHDGILIDEESREAVNLIYEVYVRNRGIGIASNIFLNVRFNKNGGNHCKISYFPDQNDWRSYKALNTRLSMISLQDIRIAPDAEITPLRFSILVKPPFNDNIVIELMAGCEGSPSIREEILFSKDNLKSRMIELEKGVYEKAEYLFDKLINEEKK